MQTLLQRHVTVLLVIMAYLAGCAPSVQEPEPQSVVSVQEVQDAIAQAQEHFELVISLNVSEIYAHDFQEAEDELQAAESLLNEDRRDEAFASAQKSLEASQRILRQFYQQMIAQSAQETKRKIEDILEEDPDSALQDFIPKLNEILDYSKEIERGQHMVDLEKILEDIEKVQQIEYDTETHISQTLESDVSFGSGRYELSEEGKRVLEERYAEFINTIKAYKAQYPNKSLLIKIKVIGHTDSTGFKRGTKLVEKLSEGIELPMQYPERGQALNKRLSEFRARTISDYLVQFIRNAIGDDPSIEIQQEIIGLGEDIPKGLPAPYGYDDARRRICKIYAYITTQ